MTHHPSPYVTCDSCVISERRSRHMLDRTRCLVLFSPIHGMAAPVAPADVAAPELLETQRGGQKLVYLGYAYRFKHNVKAGRVYEKNLIRLHVCQSRCTEVQD